MIFIRIANLTLDGYFNYGNVLQRYAMQEVLLRYSDRAESIWHTEKSGIQNALGFFTWNWKYYICFLLNWKGCRSRLRKEISGLEAIRQTQIKNFCDRYLHIRYDACLTPNISSEYDYFVVGSDQVWNPYFNGEWAFLPFAEKSKRIAYAASIAVQRIPEEKEAIFRAGLHGMEHISVREEDGARIVRELTGKKAEVLPDPTLLLSAEQWREIERRPTWLDADDYILTYFLGRRPKIVEQLGKKENIPVINILDENNFNHYCIAPEEWLYLIDHASLVYTDSFHGLVFSLQFQVPFVICDRAENALMEQMGSRIDTLLSLFGLQQRHGKKGNEYQIESPWNISYPAEYNQILERERIRSDAYLKNAFSRKG